MRRSKQFNITMFAVSAALGVVAWLLCATVYGWLVDTMNRTILIGLLFGILALVVSGGVLAVSLVCGTFEKNVVTGGTTGALIGILALATVLIVALAALFQFLYSLRFRSELLEPTSFIFLIDNSGSMSSSDPQKHRYSAIEQVLQAKDADFPYMVYGFSEDVQVLREMKPASAEKESLTDSASGGTAIRKVLEQVLSDYQDGSWSGGVSPKVVLLSDGYPTDFVRFSEISGILREYARSGINISTVGLDAVEVPLMERIAARTGGVFVSIQDASLLAGAMDSAVNRYSAGDLLTTRYDDGKLGPLFGFLRILFLTVLGTGVGAATAVAYGQADSLQIIFLSSIGKSMLGALLLELCTSLLGFSDRVFWLILWVLIAVIFCTKMQNPRTPHAGRGIRTKRRGGRSNRRVRIF